MPNQFDYSKPFFDRWYRPEYTTIIVAGDVDPNAVVQMVGKHWGGWQAGSYSVEIPSEPPPRSPLALHVPWSSSTLPWVSVAFHAPAFSETAPPFAALDVLLDLEFGRTSELYRRLVEVEQKVDELRVFNPAHADPSLVTILARLKQRGDATYVRDAILATAARASRTAIAPARLAGAVSHARYGFARTLDNSESIAGTLAAFVRFRRTYDTLNALYRQYDALTPGDLLAVARDSFTDANLVLTTLSHDDLPPEVAKLPSLASLMPNEGLLTDVPLVIQKSPSPLLRVKLLFNTGSAHDPAGKEGLAALAAEMIASAGSRDMRIDEITRALFPIAGSFTVQVDKEMTTFTGVIHRDNWPASPTIVLPQLLDPGFREEDFKRLKDAQANALVQDLRNNNEEELGKERLQTNIFAGTPYGHTALGTVAAIDAITLDEVRAFIERSYTQAALTVGLAGDLPDAFVDRLRAELSALPDGEAPSAPVVTAHRPSGIEVEIIEKDTRATAISFGHPIEVTRSHPDFPALWLARAWLGDHRAFHTRLFLRIREVRGLNYGDYAYIEAFPRGMFQFFPDPNVARRAQIFEVWIRPVPPEYAVFALKIGLHEVAGLIERGLSEAEFEQTRDYLMKNVFVMTKTQDQQLGYALDSRWYGIGDFTSYMREQMRSLTAAQVNDAVRRHLSASDLSVVMITQDAAALREQLLADEFTPMTYDSAKPPELLAEDQIIGARKLHIRPDAIRITPVEDVFAS